MSSRRRRKSGARSHDRDEDTSSRLSQSSRPSTTFRVDEMERYKRALEDNEFWKGLPESQKDTHISRITEENRAFAETIAEFDRMMDETSELILARRKKHKRARRKVRRLLSLLKKMREKGGGWGGLYDELKQKQSDGTLTDSERKMLKIMEKFRDGKGRVKISEEAMARQFKRALEDLEKQHADEIDDVQQKTIQDYMSKHGQFEEADMEQMRRQEESYQSAMSSQDTDFIMKRLMEVEDENKQLRAQLARFQGGMGMFNGQPGAPGYSQGGGGGGMPPMDLVSDLREEYDRRTKDFTEKILGKMVESVKMHNQLYMDEIEKSQFENLDLLAELEDYGQGQGDDLDMQGFDDMDGGMGGADDYENTLYGPGYPSMTPTMTPGMTPGFGGTPGGYGMNTTPGGYGLGNTPGGFGGGMGSLGGFGGTYGGGNSFGAF